MNAIKTKPPAVRTQLIRTAPVTLAFLLLASGSGVWAQGHEKHSDPDAAAAHSTSHPTPPTPAASGAAMDHGSKQMQGGSPRKASSADKASMSRKA